MTEYIPQTVLVVDDIASNIETLVTILKNDYRVKVAINGKKALEVVNSSEPPDIILLDVMMPEMDGYEVCRRIKSQIKTKNIPVIFVTAKNDGGDETLGFELGAVDYITKPIHPLVVKARIKTHLALLNHNLLLERQVAERTKDLYSTRLEVIRRLGIAAEFKDNETGQHILRMSKYSHTIAKGFGFSNSEADILLNAAPMHDVGKIGIPDSILLKPGKLTSDEWEIMKTHTLIGGKIIGVHDNALLRAARTVALTHHEKWNGQGYPEGLCGENIPIEGRIVAVADVFDALTSNRPYKEAWPVEQAFDLLLNEQGKHFDPKLIDIFFANIGQILSIKEQHTAEETSLT
ncbi:response regulator [Desulfovibrio gilichinskyi]|uniref:Response regulator receiver modulated metal dependent phosphohydrolase n=1 Tax=Desulfovibrio gilichinskyi TaxID=1519643 RepID=A0A1X7E8N5_9BACT|nr:two-component system response regulator [Desulfovibrio gilichinskyi]SMF29191.1 response regulator receiver modulated metal dependent phosphohydrolase [Desulfovibrio gilichinskyi]